ncbi:hypothetical protein [Anaeromicropila populeti]|nr:hypothetical protein [Anaeromicropila populeti]
MTLADETEILHSQLLTDDNGEKRVVVHFERPTETGFDMARCSLPSYQWIKRDGFTEEEIHKFEMIVKSNAHLFFKYAENGGIQIA